MHDLGLVHRPLADLLARELEEVATIFERQLASELSAVNGLCMHIEQYRGKMLRPTLVLLSGLAVSPESGSVTEQNRTLAAVVEMIHMATLVHDDVLDDARVRRRGQTVNALRGNETAVMLGDYLISNAFHLCSSLGEPAVNLALGRVTNTLCEGELLQLHHRDDYSLTRETYFEIIERKTASLIGECCRLGAQLSGADEELSQALHRAGIALGTAFQIQDDLLDLLGDEATVGKSLGLDIGKGKLTLPVIEHLAAAPARERGQILALIECDGKDDLRRLLESSGAIESTRQAARNLVDEAKVALDRLPPGGPRTLFIALADGVIDRYR